MSDPIRKPVPGWEELYEALSDGRIWSVRAGAFLTPSPNKKGYMTAKLSLNGYTKTISFQRVVAETFLGPASGLCVNHKDGNKANNAVENLEWVTVIQNNHHAILTGLKPASQKTINKVLAHQEERYV